MFLFLFENDRRHSNRSNNIKQNAIKRQKTNQ